MASSRRMSERQAADPKGFDSRRVLTAGALAILAWGALVRVAMTSGLRPAFFWDSASYVDYAKDWRSAAALPHLGSRTPGYPFFLLAAGRPFFSPKGAVRWQHALGIAGGVLVVLLVWTMTRRAGAAIVAGAASALFLDLVFMELVIYTEALTGAVVLCAVTLFGLASTVRRKVATTAALAGAVFAGLAPTVRPVLAAAVPVFAIAVAVLAWRKSIGKGAAVAAVLLLFAPTIGLASVNRVRDGHFALATRVGVLDFMGFPQMYLRLPPGPVRRIFVAAAARNPNGMVPWYEVIDPLVQLEEKSSGKTLTRQEVGERVSRRAVAQAPVGYALVWIDTAKRFFADFGLSMGLYATTADFEAQRPQVSPWRLATARAVRRALLILVPIFSLLAMLGPLAIGGHRLVRTRRPALPLPVLLAWGVVLAVALPTITLEAWPGTARYREPVELLIFALAVWALVAAADEVRADGWRGVLPRWLSGSSG